MRFRLVARDLGGVKMQLWRKRNITGMKMISSLNILSFTDLIFGGISIRPAIESDILYSLSTSLLDLLLSLRVPSKKASCFFSV